ncbi:hypothetical protein [Clostridium botulinum]|uniref:hypothetical protein n=1 Tax=Clostridium botulinum TaxID=1491 RepID=UPI0006A756FE|nr:hypothetical protein [Clostridium botulinum]KAI3350151.1 hypothetical protein CIT18_04540 [Clostridium botulinum]KOM88965.1 hypothetical protein ACP51_04325 [Clostridium botulinum]KOR63531.1 hypothetical protein ADT22_03110 [Clostridium botulinum]MCS6111547.1 hypothetical protein [Clostridium botulinum]NFE10967.1 hypothetical protein [Clostridium botulinum]
MNIVKKIKDIKIGDEDYIMTFDMRSIAVFKELTGKSFLQSSAKLGLLDDEVVLGFIGATLRKVNEENKPLGKQIYDMDIMYLLLNLSEIVIELVTSSLPQAKVGNKNIKKK